MAGPPAEADPIAAFAQQLGIRPEEDAEFGWLAEVGLQSPLPPRWTSHADATTGFVYYVDHDRQASSWENPLVPYLRRIVEIGRSYLGCRSEDFFEEQKGLLWHQHKHDLDAWHGPFSDAEGRSYYVNSTAGVSSWQDPRVDTQYIFELETGLLTTLAEVLPEPEADTSGWGESGNNPWKTSDGAEVLTIEESSRSDVAMQSLLSNTAKRGFQMRLTQTMKNWSRNNNRDEHKSALEKMAHTALWLRSAQLDEVEVQRLHFSRKVAERTQRRQDLVARSLVPRQSADGLRSTAAARRSSFSNQCLGPMPEETCSGTGGALLGRAVPSPLLAGLTDILESPKPAGSPTGGASSREVPQPLPPSPMARHPLPPAGSPKGNAHPSDGSQLQLLPSPMAIHHPAPAPPERGPSVPTNNAGKSDCLELPQLASPMTMLHSAPPPPSEQGPAVPTNSACQSGGPKLEQFASTLGIHHPAPASEQEPPVRMGHSSQSREPELQELPSPMTAQLPASPLAPMHTGSASGSESSQLPRPVATNALLSPTSQQDPPATMGDAGGCQVQQPAAMHQSPPLQLQSEEEPPVSISEEGIAAGVAAPDVAITEPTPIVAATPGDARGLASGIRSPSGNRGVGAGTRAGKPRLFSALAAAAPGQLLSSHTTPGGQQQGEKTSAFARHLNALRESPPLHNTQQQE